MNGALILNRMSIRFEFLMVGYDSSHCCKIECSRFNVNVNQKSYKYEINKMTQQSVSESDQFTF